MAILERVSQLRAEADDDPVERDKLQIIVELQRLTTECEELQVRDFCVSTFDSRYVYFLHAEDPV